MRFATFIHEETEKIAVVTPDGSAVCFLDEVLPGWGMTALIAESSHGVLDRIRQNLDRLKQVPIAEVVLQAPIPNPPPGCHLHG